MKKSVITNIFDCIYGITKRYFQLMNIYIILIALIVLTKVSPEGVLSSGLQSLWDELGLNKLDIKYLTLILWSAFEFLELMVQSIRYILNQQNRELINCCEIIAAIIMVLFRVGTKTISFSIDAIIIAAGYLFTIKIIFSLVSKYLLLDTRYFEIWKTDCMKNALGNEYMEDVNEKHSNDNCEHYYRGNHPGNHNDHLRKDE